MTIGNVKSLQQICIALATNESHLEKLQSYNSISKRRRIIRNGSVYCSTELLNAASAGGGSL